MRPGRRTAILTAAFMAACGGEPARHGASTTEVVAARAVTLPDDAGAAAWAAAPEFRATLLLQDMVEPRLLVPSTPELRVKALADTTRIAFRLEWPDAAKNDVPGTSSFSDACAVQLPARTEPDVPAPQMGEPQRPVEIAFWRAAWQAAVDGRPDTIQALFPGAAVDHYPFEAPSLRPGSPEQAAMAARYAPARALGNAMAGPRERSVEDLVAEGPSTLHPAPATSSGRGARTADGWAVVLSRPLPEGLGIGGRTQVAFAVWDGAGDETGARKMRTGWVPLLLEAGR